jgi:hypothetical protein
VNWFDDSKEKNQVGMFQNFPSFLVHDMLQQSVKCLQLCLKI